METESLSKKVQSGNLFQATAKEAGILVAITLLAGLLLGFVYELTKEPIAKQEALAVQNACREAFPALPGAAEAERFDLTAEGTDEETAAALAADGVRIGKIFEAVSASGERLGWVVETTSSEGYGGHIVLYAGIGTDGSLRAVSILSISETPGLGMRAEKVLVPQFRDRRTEQAFVYTKTGASAENEIDAISGATITTRAFTNAVNGAVRAVAGWISE